MLHNFIFKLHHSHISGREVFRKYDSERKLIDPATVRILIERAMKTGKKMNWKIRDYSKDGTFEGRSFDFEFRLTLRKVDCLK